MSKLQKKHPLAIRWFHWVNFPVLLMMIWSGILIYWANDAYRVGWGNSTLLHFFPAWFYKSLRIPFRLAEGMAWHFFFMWFFAINGLLYVLYTAISGEWRDLLPKRDSFGDAWQVVLHDLHIRKEPLPRAKYNGAQRIAYTSIIVMGLGSLLTGLAIFKPTQFAWLSAPFNGLAPGTTGYLVARFIHFWLTIGYVMFFVIHILQVARAGWNNFRAMITGYKLVPANSGSTPPPAAAAQEISDVEMQEQDKVDADAEVETKEVIAYECPPSHQLAKRISVAAIGVMGVLVTALIVFNMVSN